MTLKSWYKTDKSESSSSKREKATLSGLLNEIDCFEEWFIIESRENPTSPKRKKNFLGKTQAIEFSSVKQTGAGKVRVQRGAVFVS